MNFLTASKSGYYSPTLVSRTLRRSHTGVQSSNYNAGTDFCRNPFTNSLEKAPFAVLPDVLCLLWLCMFY
jgi:hypothetical protein